MKFIYILFASLIMLTSAWAQSPEKMSYQAVIRNNNNQLITNQPVGMQISILQGSVNGTAIYVEEHNPTSNANGLVNIEIGNGNVTSGNFESIDWASGPYFIKSETDPTGGTAYTITGTSQLLSVPYALHAKTAEVYTGTLNETDPVFKTSVAIGITEADTANWNKQPEEYTESDPLFIAWDKTTDISISESQISDLRDYVEAETDPGFTASVAAGITALDTASWNNKLNNYVESQRLADVLSQNNDGEGYQIKNISDPTDVQDAVTKGYVDALIQKISELETLTTTFKDYDGNLYSQVKIGEQVWMAENLKTTHYANGDVISDGTGKGSIQGETEPKYWFTYDDDPDNNYIYGKLYTWYVASDTRNVCPAGWHVPTNEEWTVLSDYLEGSSVSGGKLKEQGTSHWLSPNSGATNESGFIALPGGYRGELASFNELTTTAIFWSASEYSTGLPWYWGAQYHSLGLFNIYNSAYFGCSIRCIKD